MEGRELSFHLAEVRQGKMLLTRDGPEAGPQIQAPQSTQSLIQT